MFHYFNNLVNAANGNALPGYLVYVLDASGTIIPIYSDESGTPIQTVSDYENAAITDAEGNYDLYVDDGTYSLQFRTVTGSILDTIVNVPMISNVTLVDLSADGGAALVGTSTGDTVQQELDAKVATMDLAASTGSSLVGFIQSGTGAVAGTAQAALRRQPIAFEDFGAVGDGVADDTTAIQNTIAEAESSGRSILMQPKQYRFTSTLEIRDEIVMLGSGNNNSSTILINDIANTAAVAIDIYCELGESIIGLELGNFTLSTPGTYAAGWDEGGIGIRMDTDDAGPAISFSSLHDIAVMNHQIGIDLGGVLYKCSFDRIKVSGDIPETGTPLGPSIVGFRSGVISFYDVTYNTFTNLEATQVRNGGYAFYMSSQFSSWTNTTADGPSRFSSVGGTSINHTCESFVPTTLPVGVNYAMFFNGFSSVVAPCLRNVPVVTGLTIGITMQGDGWTLTGARNDGTMPDRPIYLDGTGSLTGITMTGVGTKIPATGAGGLNGSVALNCASVTDYGFEYTADTAWTPDFSSWDTAPTLSSARYTRMGNLVTVFINANNGVLGAGDTIGGLPTASSSSVGGTAVLACGDGSKNVTARIFSSATTISGFPAQDLTGEFWQLSATYRV
jgi:hypothetical protein